MTPGRRDSLILGGIGLAAALAGAVVGAFSLQSRSGAADLLAAEFHDLAGQPRRLRDWVGKPLLVNFWATWCAPCREEMPLLSVANEQYAAKRLQIVGIGIDSGANIAEFVKSVQIAYPILVAGSAAIDLMRKLGNTAGGLPYTIVLEPSGAVVGRKLGPYSQRELTAVLDGLLR